MSTLGSVPGYGSLVHARLFTSLVAWIDFTLIFSILSFNLEADALTIGMATALYGLPGLVLGPGFGTLADRHDPFAVLFSSYAVRCGSSLLLIFTADVPLFLLLVFIKGIANLGAMPAEQRLLQRMLSHDQQAPNASIMAVVDQAAKIAAPLVGATFASLRLPGSGFGLSVVLSLAGAFSLLHVRRRIRSPAPGRQSAPARSDAPVRPEAGPGHASPHVHPPPPQSSQRTRQHALMALMRDSLEFRLAFIAATAQTAVLGIYDPLLALFLKDQGMPAATFGLIVSATAVGGIVGAVGFRVVRANARIGIGHGVTGFGFTIVVPGLLAAAGVPLPPGLMLVLWLGNGAAYAVTMMRFGVALQHLCPASVIGSVSATTRSLQMGALVAGPMVGAHLGAWMGLPWLFVLSGGSAMAGGVALVAWSGRLRGRAGTGGHGR
jgi:hypothetical protein